MCTLLKEVWTHVAQRSSELRLRIIGYCRFMPEALSDFQSIGFEVIQHIAFMEAVVCHCLYIHAIQILGSLSKFLHMTNNMMAALTFETLSLCC